MKQAFDKGDAPSGTSGQKSPVKMKTPKATAAKTPRKKRAKAPSSGDDDTDHSLPLSTPKRKRTPSNKKAPAIKNEDNDNNKPEAINTFKPDPYDDDDDDSSTHFSDASPSKRQKTATTTPTLKANLPSDTDVFFDAPEYGDYDVANECKSFYFFLFHLFSLPSPSTASSMQTFFVNCARVLLER